MFKHAYTISQQSHKSAPTLDSYKYFIHLLVRNNRLEDHQASIVRNVFHNIFETGI
jgi:hypothetical protein